MNSTSIQLYNTLTRRKEPLQTERPDHVNLYVCGPTVYNYAHIGNARPAVIFDVLARLLRHDYASVTYARNFTDVDDKINAAAAAAGVPISTITARYIAAYHNDMKALGVQSPDLEPRVTDHIPAIVGLINTLIERGHAYCEQEHVLFHVPSYTDYGHLSGRRPEDRVAGARIEVAPYKRDPQDFVLWKPSSPEQPGWASPWGIGRPGWHVECSAMIRQHLGSTLDIHGGGQDLIFPHHENEIAQGTCAHNRRYCHTWVHNSFVTVNGQKMSKSMSNVLLVKDLLQQAPGEAIRLALLSTHYRHPLDWNQQRLSAACRTLSRFYTSLAAVDQVVTPPDIQPDDHLLSALRNDLNFSGAIARLHELANTLDKAEKLQDKAQAKGALLASGNLLGLLQQVPHTALQQLQHNTVPPTLSTPAIEALVVERNLARKQGDFQRADELRQTLLSAGIIIHDTPQGTQWHLQEKEPVI